MTTDAPSTLRKKQRLAEGQFGGRVERGKKEK
jgi:hypothetical protein